MNNGLIIFASNQPKRLVKVQTDAQHGDLFQSQEAIDFEKQIAEFSGCALKKPGSQPASNVKPRMAIQLGNQSAN